MDQRWISGSMLTAGIGLFGVVAWIQTDRYAFTSIDPAPVEPESIQMVIAPAKPAEITPPVAEANEQVLEMPVDSIVVRRRAAAAAPAEAAPPEATPEPQTPTPCSPWEEIGPVRVDDGNPTGVRRFRKLC